MEYGEVSKRLKEVNDAFWTKLTLPSNIGQNTQDWKVVIKNTTPRMVFGFITLTEYTTQIGNYGFVSVFTVKGVSDKFTSQIFKRFGAIPAGFDMSRIVMRSDIFSVECQIDEFRLFYQKEVGTLWYEVDYELRYVNVSPGAGIKVTYDPNTPRTINLFDLVHEYNIQNAKLQNTSSLYNAVYSEYRRDKTRVTVSYYWLDANNQYVGNNNGDGDLLTSSTLDNAEYRMYINKGNPLIERKTPHLEIKLLMVPIIQRIEYVAERFTLVDSPKLLTPNLNDIYIERIFPVKIQLGPSGLNSKVFPKTLFLAQDTLNWEFCHEFPSADLIRAKVSEFEKKIIGLVPEAILIGLHDFGLDAEIKRQGQQNGLQTAKMGVIGALMKLQNGWAEFIEETLMKYLGEKNKEDEFGCIRTIWKYIIEQSVLELSTLKSDGSPEVSEFIGLYLCNRYFSFISRQTCKKYTSDKVFVGGKQGTYVAVSHKSVIANRPVRYTPTSMSICFQDDYNRWFNTEWSSGIEALKSKIVEQIAADLDIECVWLIETLDRYDILKILHSPLIAGEDGSAIDVYSPPYTDQYTYAVYVCNGILRHIVRVNGSNIITKYESVIDDDDDLAHRIICGGMDRFEVPNSYQYCDVYIIQSLPVCVPLNKNSMENNVYHHLKTIQVCRYQFNRFLGEYTTTKSLLDKMNPQLRRLKVIHLEYPSRITGNETSMNLDLNWVPELPGLYMIRGSGSFSTHCVTFRYNPLQ